MIDRIVEYWLTSSTERVYQQPFVQVLSVRGEKVVHVSTHGVGEQGKDIITQLPDGTYNAYQLKSGDINKSDWHKIYGEIVELIELPIQYPGAAGTTHTSILVTNGTITADVRLSIQALNDGNERRGFGPLQVIEQAALTQLFVEAHGRYLPFALPDLKRFLDLYNSDGQANLKKTEFAEYMSSLFNLSQNTSRREAARQITSATLLGGYLMTPYVHSENHVAICEARVITIALIHHALLRSGLDPATVEPTLQLLRDEIVRELGLLSDEVERREGNFIEGSPAGDGELMYSVRVTIVLGWLATYHLINRRNDSKYAYPPSFKTLLTEQASYTGIWGEYAVPYICAIASYWRSMGDHETADVLLGRLLRTIVGVNNSTNRAGVPSPYLTPDDLMCSYLGMPGREIDAAQFSGSSYAMRSLVDVLAFHGRRDLLEPIWPLVTETRSIEYYPSETPDFLLWRSENGAERDFGYPLPTSYSDLRNSLADNSFVPEPLHGCSDFAMLFLLTYPHRLRRDLFLDMVRHGY